MMKQPTPVQPSDATLVAACLSGERGAFVEIVQRHQALVCAVAYQGTGDFGASEDVAQDTFVTAWKKLRGLREPDKLRGWLTRIASTLAVEWLRKNGPRARSTDSSADEHPAGPARSFPGRSPGYGLAGLRDAGLCGRDGFE
jgi:DNA-directed RNA polymerase specialized sigma24 family protein